MHYRCRPKWGRQDDFCAGVPLPIVAGVTRFANVDLIAQGLSPFRLPKRKLRNRTRRTAWQPARFIGGGEQVEGKDSVIRVLPGFG